MGNGEWGMGNGEFGVRNAEFGIPNSKIPIPHSSFPIPQSQIRIRMTFMVSYDIGNDRKRTRLAHILLESGCIRVQKSVFWGHNFSPKRLLKLRQRVQACVEKDAQLEDSVLYLPVEQDYHSELIWYGSPDWAEKWQNPPDFMIF